MGDILAMTAVWCSGPDCTHRVWMLDEEVPQRPWYCSPECRAQRSLGEGAGSGTPQVVVGDLEDHK